MFLLTSSCSSSGSDAGPHERNNHGLLLSDQDRSQWDRDQIVEGQALVPQVLSSGPPGPFALQAAIAAVHADVPEPASTDWAEIVGLYDALARVQPSAVVELVVLKTATPPTTPWRCQRLRSSMPLV